MPKMSSHFVDLERACDCVLRENIDECFEKTVLTETVTRCQVIALMLRRLYPCRQS